MKNILITGASQGIGRGIAEHFLELGDRVMAVARSVEKLRELQAHYPAQVLIYPFDLKNVEEVEHIFLFCRELGFKLDGMVHAAGIAVNSPVKVLEPHEVEETLKVNYMAYVQLCRFFSLKKYSNNGASIIGISSRATSELQMGLSNYAASKSAMQSFSTVMSKEIQKRKLRINTIAPSWVDTEMTSQSMENIVGLEEHLEKTSSLGFIPVKQVAYLVEFLLSDHAKYITGSVFEMTAGRFDS